MDDDEELVTTIERYFRIRFYPDELSKTGTFGQLCEVVVRVMNEAQPPVPYAFDQFWAAIQEIAADVLGVSEDDITPVTRFSELNM